MRIRDLFLLSSALTISTTAFSQTENSAFTATGRGVATAFVTDYQALGVNPSNLDWPTRFEGKKFTVGAFEFAGSVYSEAFSRSVVRDNLFFRDQEQLTEEEKEEIALDFISSENTVNIDLMTTGMAFQTNTIGSFGFSIVDNFSWHSRFGETATDLMFFGFTSSYFDELILTTGDTIPNTDDLPQDVLDLVIAGIVDPENARPIAELLEGTELQTSWMREYRVGWGKRLYSNDDLAIFGGLGAKYIRGFYTVSFYSDGTNAGGFAAVTPFFDIEFDGASENPSFTGENSGVLPDPVGQGFGFDIGFSAIIKEKLRVGVSLNNIGSVTWDGNLYTLSEVDLTEFEHDGTDNLAIIEQVEAFLGGDGAIQWSGESKRTTNLPKNLRVGVGYRATDWLDVGADAILPVDDEVGSYNDAVLGVGGDLSPAKWVTFSLGFMTGGNYDFKIPAGILFRVGNGTWECGFASRDMLTFLTEDKPTASLSTGFLRFRF